MLRRLFRLPRRKTSCPSTKYYRPRLEGLEDRCLANVDMWMGRVSTDWNNGANWSLNAVPGQGDDVQLDGRPFTNNAVTLSTTTKVLSVTMQNQYTKTMTLGNNVVLEANTFNLNTDTAAVATINFGTGSKLQADQGNSLFKNFSFTGQRGTVWIRQPQPGVAASLNVSSDQASSTASDFLIGGSVTWGNSATVFFDGGAGITIAAGTQANGAMTIGAMNGTILWSGYNLGIIENHGTISYTGAANTTTQVKMPLLNHKTVSFDGAAKNGAEIDFPTTGNATNGYSIKMDDGSMNLSNQIRVGVAGNGYYQTGGTLQDTGNVTITDVALGVGNVDVAGGLVTFAGMNFGFLDITNGANFNFSNAELDIRINGQQNQADDFIWVTQGSINIGLASKLVVTNTNPPVFQLLQWTILQSPVAITTNFTPPLNLPPLVNQPTAAQLAAGRYTLNS